LSRARIEVSLEGFLKVPALDGLDVRDDSGIPRCVFLRFSHVGA
jgi:hypothetical protein